MRSPQVSRILEETGLRQHDLALAYLSRVSGASFDHAFEKFLKHDPNLTTLTETEKLALFSLDSDAVRDLSFLPDAPLKVCRESRQRRLSRLRPP